MGHSTNGIDGTLFVKARFTMRENNSQSSCSGKKISEDLPFLQISGEEILRYNSHFAHPREF